MAPTNPTVLTLQKMPCDMLSLIVSKVGATSSVDYVNTILTCKKLNISFDNYFVAKDLDLQALVQRPREANNYKSLMESCLRRNNVELKTACSACFHHYFLNEFVNLMMGLQPTVEVL